jgi:ATP-binding cassette, subfamily G (WHITE), member 2, PDR
MPLAVPQLARTDSYILGHSNECTNPQGRMHEDEDLDSFEDHYQRNEEIHRLASKITAESSAQAQDPFNATPDGPLDPNGPGFDARAWISAFYNLHLQDPEAPARRSGVALKDLSVHGFGTATDFQKTVGNVFLDAIPTVSKLFGPKGNKIQILQGFDGVLHSGEMLCVLGPPGSGCSTLLKTIAGETHGLYLDERSYLNYRGVTPQEMRTQFRGEATYTAEDDSHLPMLSVGDTLHFAALARSPRSLPGGINRGAYAKHLSKVVMAALGYQPHMEHPRGRQCKLPCHGPE